MYIITIQHTAEINDRRGFMATMVADGAIIATIKSLILPSIMSNKVYSGVANARVSLVLSEGENENFILEEINNSFVATRVMCL